MSTRNDRASERRERRKKEIQQRRTSRREVAERQSRQSSITRYGLMAVGVLVVAGLLFGGYTIVDDWQSRRPPDGVQEFDNLSRTHTNEPVQYAQVPPVGGEHNPVWQNCGFYPAPVNNENAVHSLEHGAVWITFQPDIDQVEIDRLRDLAEQSYVLVSPYPEGLPSPIVASAWGKQMTFDTADDPDLDRFLSAFRQGPQTPEPGAACHAGTSATR